MFQLRNPSWRPKKDTPSSAVITRRITSIWHASPSASGKRFLFFPTLSNGDFTQFSASTHVVWPEQTSVILLSQSNWKEGGWHLRWMTQKHDYISRPQLSVEIVASSPRDPVGRGGVLCFSLTSNGKCLHGFERHVWRVSCCCVRPAGKRCLFV